MRPIRLSDWPPVARTLIIPLVYRARESQRPDALLRDPQAQAVVAQFEEDVWHLVEESDFYQVCVMLRARYFDACARRFLAEQPHGIVVDIGCGLDTRFCRLDNGQMIWFGVDLPEVIRLREQVLPETPRSRLTACSVLDFTWMETVAAQQRPAIFLAEGVMAYFTTDEIRRVVQALGACFPGAELVFDAISSLSRWGHTLSDANLKKSGARIHSSLDDGRALEGWGLGLHLLDEWFYYQDNEPRLGWFNLSRYIPFIGKANRVVRYRFGDHRQLAVEKRKRGVNSGG